MVQKLLPRRDCQQSLTSHINCFLLSMASPEVVSGEGGYRDSVSVGIWMWGCVYVGVTGVCHVGLLAAEIFGSFPLLPHGRIYSLKIHHQVILSDF